MNGRDIGTVVFPAASVKFFLDAAISEERNDGWPKSVNTIQRRLMNKHSQISLSAIAATPHALIRLCCADDAIVIDSRINQLRKSFTE